MRHFFSPRPVAPCPFGMRALSPAAGLVTRAGRQLASPPDEWAAISGAINLAAVAAAANQRLGAACRADEQPRRRGLVATRQVDTAWTVAVVGVILTPHTCPARCEGTASNGTARLRSAPCLFLVMDSLLPCHPPRRQAVRATRRSIKSPKHRSHPGVARCADKVRNRRLDAGSNSHRHHFVPIREPARLAWRPLGWQDDRQQRDH
jgi:hypothetical protein